MPLFYIQFMTYLQVPNDVCIGLPNQQEGIHSNFETGCVFKEKIINFAKTFKME